MNLISAGRAFRLANIQEDRKADLLFYVTSSTRTPIARLIAISDISIVLPLSETASAISSIYLVAPIIAKPAVAKLKECSVTYRWHRRLGHVGPLILSKTKGFAEGLDGLDTSELTHCVACHFSKAQRTITREQRPIPFGALDEVFVEMAGPIELNILNQRYAVIITDDTTRMRWWFGAIKKDEIPSCLVDWVTFMKTQYGKTVRVCFSDGGSKIQRNSKWHSLGYHSVTDTKLV
ncbi:hypothetical protein K3495_g7958 [Podosphaera aphanis]|nr:hypothetical protein K3495_g7958 [Podosphaera aphanis]